MNAVQARQADSFRGLLAAPGRSPEIPEASDVCGWLVGRGELEVLPYKAVDVRARHIRGEAHFFWVLEGRAIQDVWIMPRGLGSSSRPGQGQQYLWHDAASGRHGSSVAY
jgi:hypothetical protein